MENNTTQGWVYDDAFFLPPTNETNEDYSNNPGPNETPLPEDDDVEEIDLDDDDVEEDGLDVEEVEDADLEDDEVEEGSLEDDALEDEKNEMYVGEEKGIY